MLKKLSVLFAALFIGGLVSAYSFGFIGDSSSPEMTKVKSVLDFTVKNIDGKDVKLKTYKGDVLLIVNTASKCGYTPQYEGLQAIYDEYKAQGFTVLGFPANNFGGQEPGKESEIKEFCESKYKVKFPMFAKISVKGEDQAALYKFLTAKETNPKFAGDISWNFNKFLVNRKGEIVARFSSKDTPESEAVKQAIEKYLKEK
ncbi:MAG TPA: redoxin domain-containing protein [Pyrinomonadaceae bacterium]|nr:redoxin domain-containing protein [Pyrinomonadaceae bacterium]